MTTRQFQESSALRIFLSYFKPHRKLFFLDMCCALMIAVIDLAFPYVSRWCMYQLLPESAYRTFFAVMAVVFCAYILRSVFTYIICYYGHTFGILVEADIRRDLFRHMQELSFDYYDRNRTGQLMSRLTADLFDITELAHHGPEDIFISSVTIIGAIAVLFTVQWRLALVVCCIIPVFLLVVMYRRRQMSQASRAAKQKTGAINAEIESGLSGVRTTKAFANEAEQQRRFDGANEVFKTSKRNFHKEMGFFNASMELFISLLSVAVIAAGGWLIMKNRLNYIDLITFSLYITTFISPVRKLANFAEMFSNGFAGLHRFIELMATEPTIQDAPDAVDLTDVRGEVALNHVTFSYDNGSPEVLHGVDLTVRAGETVAIVGPSGGGKSTLCQLVPRFYDPDSGTVSVDGHDVRCLTQHSLRRSIGIVQQDVFLFADTIANNIRYGRADATMEEIREAARQIGSVDLQSPTLSTAGRLDYAKNQVLSTVRKVAPYVLVGVAIGAAIHNFIPQAFVERVLGCGQWYAVPLATLVGVPMYADIFGTIPIAESLYAKGAGLGTVLAFMMAVTALSLPSLVMLRKAVKPKLLAVFTGIVTVGIMGIGFLFNLVGPLFA